MNHLIQLLQQARHFDNLFLRNSVEVEAWRIAVDKALENTDGDDPRERWDYPARVEHRRFVKGLFR